MKRKSLFFAMLAVAGMGPAVRADYVTTFSVPPYVLDESVVGIDGWENRFPAKDDKAAYAARVVALRWNDYKPGLMLRGGSLKRTNFGAKVGDKQKVTVQLAVNFAEGRSGKALRVIFWPATFGEIFFDQGPGGGLGYQGDGTGTKGQGTIVVPKEVIRVNSFYTFTVLLDYSQQTYDITVTGVKKDGAPFRYSAAGVAFEPSKSKAAKIDSLLIVGTGYLGALSVESLAPIPAKTLP
ncbi:MAG: hypothetical protein PCFJNLEI_03955 [Verrucomicrobiae bacterium]|nr:hypothetical protein [Verrucomicrobiae bacterium]